MVERSYAMETHKSMIWQCPMLRYVNNQWTTCDAVIAIALDMGPSAFRCPACRGVYIVGPREAAHLQRPDGEMEISGKRLETYYGYTVQKLEMDGTWENFLQAKVGSVYNLYIANRVG
jgi:hypothetical protein